MDKIIIRTTHTEYVWVWDIAVGAWRWTWDNAVGAWCWKRPDGSEVYLVTQHADIVLQMCAIVGVDVTDCRVAAYIDEMDWTYDVGRCKWRAETWDGWRIDVVVNDETTWASATGFGAAEYEPKARDLREALLEIDRWARWLWGSHIEVGDQVWSWDSDADVYVGEVDGMIVEVFQRRSGRWYYQVSGEQGAHATDCKRPSDAIDAAIAYVRDTYSARR